MEVYFSETVGLYLLFPMGAAEGRDHKVPEPLGVDHRGPVRLVLVQHERQGPHVRVPPAGRLRNVHLQAVDLEEIIFVHENSERPGRGMRFLFQVVSDPLLQILRDALVVHGVAQPDQIRPSLVLRDVSVDAQVCREDRSLPVRHGGYRLPEILSLGHA